MRKRNEAETGFIGGAGLIIAASASGSKEEGWSYNSTSKGNFRGSSSTLASSDIIAEGGSDGHKTEDEAEEYE
jgi:hypothetical protein